MAFDNLKGFLGKTPSAEPKVEEPKAVSPEHKANLEKMSEFQKIHEINPAKSSYQLPGDFEKDEKGEVIKTLDPKTGTMKAKPHFTPYSEIAEDPEKLKSVIGKYHQPEAIELAKSRKAYAEEEMKLPENIGPVTKRVLSHPSYEEMDAKDKNMFNTFYKEATKQSFIPNFKEDVLDYKGEGDIGLFISDWSDAIRSNPNFKDALMQHIPADMISNVAEEDEPEALAKYLYQTSDKTLDKIQDTYYKNALREIIKHKKGK